MKKLTRYVKISAGVLPLLFLTTACSSSSPAGPQIVREQVTVVEEREVKQDIPGVVQYIWEEPMVDVVEVPPGLDPEGHYYRPAHQAVVEIKQGRWQYYRKQGQ